jgi:DNA-binding transcriptional LysR family regulator
VVEEGSFSKAAKKLYLSQPTISGHIRNLEAFIGTTLLNRLPRQIVPTQAGKLLYRHGQLILNAKKAAIRDLRHILNCEQGELAVSGSTIPAEYLLPPVIASFRAEHPHVRVEIRISDSKRSCADVRRGRAELGFVGATFEAEELEFRYFASDELALVVPDTPDWQNVESIALSELVTKPFLARESGSGTRKAFEKLVGNSLNSFNLIGCFGSTGAIKEALKANIGVSVLSTLAVNTELRNGLLKIVKIEGIESMKRSFYVVRNKKLSLSPIAEGFLRYALPAANADNDSDSTHLRSKTG